MYTTPPKKMLILNILDVLRNHSDGEHRLSQRRIIDILEKDYQMKVERKAVKRNLIDLLDAGLNVQCTTAERTGKDGRTQTVYSDWHIVPEFTNAEIRLITDSLLFSKHMPHAQCRRLIDKVEKLGGREYRPSSKNVSTVSDSLPENKQLFFTVDVLDEAIVRKRKVSFTYNDFGTDKKLHPRLAVNGEPRSYVVNPYQMVAANGRYYLIGNYDKYDNLAHYRVDRITEVRILEGERSKPLMEVPEAKRGLDIPRHMAKHIYMFAGPNVRAEFKMPRHMVNQVVDWFGSDARFDNDESDPECLIMRVTANEEALRYWTLQYCSYVQVLSPASLVETVRADLKAALDNYEQAHIVASSKAIRTSRTRDVIAPISVAMDGRIPVAPSDETQ